MRNKATAEKSRQAFDLKDPYPAAMLLDDGVSEKGKSEITVRNNIDGNTADEVTKANDESEITVRNSNVAVGGA